MQQRLHTAPPHQCCLKHPPQKCPAIWCSDPPCSLTHLHSKAWLTLKIMYSVMWHRKARQLQPFVLQQQSALKALLFTQRITSQTLLLRWHQALELEAAGLFSGLSAGLLLTFTSCFHEILQVKDSQYFSSKPIHVDPQRQNNNWSIIKHWIKRGNEQR